MAQPNVLIVAHCPKCGRTVDSECAYSWCTGCYTPLPEDIKVQLPKLKERLGQEATVEANRNVQGVSAATASVSFDVKSIMKDNKMAIGIVISIIGIALIVISPSLFSQESYASFDWRNPGIRTETLHLRGIALFFGAALLIVGGIIFAVGLNTKKAIQPNQQVHRMFLYQNGQQSGPYPMEAIVEWYQSGKLSESDRVFNRGSNQWVPVASFLGMNNSTITSPASNTISSLDELEKLASLKEKGIVTEEEYEKKKKQILGI